MPTKNEEPLLSCRQLSVGHRGRSLLPPIDVEVRRGEYWAVLGRNGAGKTTWLRTLLGLLSPLAGYVVFPSGALRLSYLGQSQRFDDLHPLFVRDVVAMGTCREGTWLSALRAEGAERVAKALALVGVSELAERPFRQLSEGQKQRVLLARLVASEADLAVLDEPMSAMDPVAEREASALLRALQADTGLALLVVSHDLELAAQVADRAILLDREADSVVVGTPQQVFEHPAFLRRYGAGPAGALQHG
jgi:zinc transport system ATP-binding protein